MDDCYICEKIKIMELDSSVRLSVDRSLEIISELGPEAFASKVLSCMPKDVRSGDLGCGRILADYSIMMHTRYVLCDIYEDGQVEDGGAFRYRVDIKSGKKTSRVGDAVYCVMFLLVFWFLRTWSSQGFNPLFLVLSALVAVAALYLLWSGMRDKFGMAQSTAIAASLEASFSCGHQH